MKKVFLTFLSSLMLVSNFVIMPINADDENTQNGPENQNDVVVQNSDLTNQEEINQEKNQENNQEINQEVENEETKEKYLVTYMFIEGDAKSGFGDIPEEVNALLPESEYHEAGEVLTGKDLSSYEVGDWKFASWEPLKVDPEGSNILYGIWTFNGTRSNRTMLRASSTLYAGFASSTWGLHKNGYVGTHPFRLGGNVAYCVESNKQVPSVGASYSYAGIDNSKIARIIGNGEANGMSQAAIQATLWNYLDNNKSSAWVSSGETVDWEDDVYSGGSWEVDLYSPSNSSYQVYATSARNTYVPPTIYYGNIVVKKTSANANMTSGNSAYSLANAVYGVYSDANCSNQVGTVTTDINGNSNALTVQTGTYYVKEKTASTGYNLDTTTYTVTVSNNQTSTVNSVETPKPVYVYVNKKEVDSSFSYLENCPNNYSLAGAEYDVYSDSGLTNFITTLTTNETGKTNTAELAAGTYYIKEVTPSFGFRLDNTTYTLRASTPGQTYSITSNETPLTDPVTLVLYKQNARYKTNVENLDKAYFTLSYYDEQIDDVSGLTPKFSWVFKTKFNSTGKAVLIFDSEHYVSGDELLLDSANRFYLPLGTFTIEETQAPPTFARDENVYVGHIYEHEGTAVHEINGSSILVVNNESLTQSELLQTITLKIQKIDAETGLAQAQGIATLENAVFQIWKKDPETGNKIDYGTISTDENGLAVLEYEPDGVNKCLPGHYYYQEIQAPNGYTLNSEIYEIDCLATELNTANFEYTVEVADKVTSITVHKVDSNGEYIGQDDASLQLVDKLGNVLYEWNTDGSPHTIKGLTVNTDYILHESYVNPKFMLAEDKEVTVSDATTKNVTMIDKNIKIGTVARYKETNNKNYVADGVAHIIDKVNYENLYVGETYLLVANLIDKQTENIINETEKHFVPESSYGSVEVEISQQLDNLDGHDLVIYEYLYHLVDGSRISVVNDADINNANQTVHVDDLYRADFVLEKVDADTGEYIDGVTFNIKTSRTKRDSTYVEEDLGNFTTVDGKITLQDLKEDTEIVVTEVNEAEGYYKWPESFTFNIGHDNSVETITKTIENHEMEISTTAKFKENNSKNYAADGVAHIVDTIKYKWVYANNLYEISGKLVDKNTGNVIMTQSEIFIPSSTAGEYEMEFEVDLDGYDNHDFVVFETLSLIDDSGNRIKPIYHEDINDENQTVHVDELYKADFILNKYDADSLEPMNGVLFEINGRRTKADGTDEQFDYGKMITGGIYHEENSSFTYSVGTDFQLDNVVGTYESQYDAQKDKYFVRILDLADGEYYGSAGGSSTKYIIAKGKIILPELKKDTKLTVKELETLEGYYLPREAYSFDVGHDESKSELVFNIENHLIKIATSAVFEETSSKNYVADGYAHVIDTVTYDYLYKDDLYVLKGRLIDLGTDENPVVEEVMVSETEFHALDLHGEEEVMFEFDFTGYDNHKFVVVEELHHVLSEHEVPLIDDVTGDVILDEQTGQPIMIIEQETVKVAEHYDLDDEKQTVHIDELYRADVSLYKVNESQSNKLNGAIFTITTKRTRRDGEVVERDLGKFVSGGIYYEQEEEFEYLIATDEEMNNVVATLKSSKHPKFATQFIQKMDLTDGIYYGKVKDNEEIRKYRIAKGLIYLEAQEEDTIITCHEELAPEGYFLLNENLTIDVGHEYNVSLIEKQVINKIIPPRYIVPKTGV